MRQAEVAKTKALREDAKRREAVYHKEEERLRREIRMRTEAIGNYQESFSKSQSIRNLMGLHSRESRENDADFIRMKELERERAEQKRELAALTRSYLESK